MVRYLNRSGESGVNGYEIASHSIVVEFNDRSVYLYTYASAGPVNIEKMKALAQLGQGLNSFINTYVKEDYVRKLR